jgi:Saxitoxin biosynthesis operon protein SxtJ
MRKLTANLSPENITKEQSKDTGMAMVLLLLIFSVAFKGEALVMAAIAVLVINMIVPQVYRPIAILWFGVSHLLGTVMSRILLALVFFTVVTPMGVARRLLGKDSLQLKIFKAGDESVMKARNHTFVAEDIETPY